MSIKNKIIGFMERHAGMEYVSPSHRGRIIAGQIDGVLQMMPLASFGALVCVVLVNFLLWNTAGKNSAVSVGAVILLLQGFGLKTYLNQRGRTFREGSISVLRRIGFNGAVFGALWGVTSVLLLTHVDSGDLFVSGILLAGILLSTVYCFRSVFQASISFILTSGIMLGIAFLSRPEFVSFMAAAALLILYFSVVPFIALTQSKDFVSNFHSKLKSEDEAEISDGLLRQFEETGHEWFWSTDSEGNLERASKELRLMLASTNKNFANASVRTSLVSCDKQPNSQLRNAIEQSLDFEHIKVPLEITGSEHWISFSGKCSRREDGSSAGYYGVCSDVTKEKLAEEKIVEMAMRDGLTGLHNRTSFYDQMDAMVRRLERYGTSFSLMFLDLDKFKLVNDTYGHHIGDGLLQEAAQRILAVLRENDIVGRLGGDEFGIIVEETSDPVFIAKLASRIIQEVSQPYFVEGETLYIGISVGVALAPMHGTQREQLLRNADLALYRAKDDGRGVFRYFEAQMDFEQRERRMLEQEMRNALNDDEFEMKFQPMINMRTGRVSCMEALIRWNHEIRGLLSPDEFISIAEQSNLIVEVGRWSLLSACRTAMSWPEDVCVAVNVSALHFMRSNIIEDVSDVLKETGLAPNRLEVEITESILIDHNDETVTKLRGLRELGVSIAMDDFGTGYSSLGYLTRFRFDRLKIDRSFLMDMEKDDDRKAIVYTICTLGENLGIDITVEGVETLEHVEFLKTIHCDQAQGFYYSKPLSSNDVAAFLLKTFNESISEYVPPHKKLKSVG